MSDERETLDGWFGKHEPSMISRKHSYIVPYGRDKGNYGYLISPIDACSKTLSGDSMSVLLSVYDELLMKEGCVHPSELQEDKNVKAVKYNMLVHDGRFTCVDKVDIYVCGKCNAPLERNQKYCKECGTKLIWEEKKDDEDA